MRAHFYAACLFVAAACGGKIDNNGDDGDGGGSGKMDACVGLECDVVNCGAMSMPPTTLTGKVFAPNGTLPLYGANVYIPREDVGTFPDGAQCSRCSADLPGSPIVQTVTNEAGEFRLENVPAGANVPLVIALGKWRRQVMISTVNQCSDNALPATQTSLPKNKSEGDIPKIAITTGDADALECLMRKIGIDLGEMTNAGGAGRIHLYSGDGANQIQGGGAMTAATSLWSDPAKLKDYDIVIFSCEGSQLPDGNGGTMKTQGMLNNVKEYADIGGRVFLSHWHNVWVGGAFASGGQPTPPVWKDIATWNDGGTLGNGTVDLIDEVNNPKGASFATWMTNVMGSPMRGRIPIQDNTGKRTAATVVEGKAERWVYLKEGQTEYPQNFQFTTPNEVGSDARCGKVVFSDMHVSGDSKSSPGTAFPGQCSGNGLTPQEKALAFMFFDIATCVGGIL